MGREQSVAMVPQQDIAILMPVTSGGKLAAEVVYNGPIEAPVTQGQVLGELVLRPENLPEIRHPLVAAQSVATGGFGLRVKTAAMDLFNTFIRGPEGDASKEAM
jgi:D-alanyl-D-alanine carboxypeptidase (penicillin-binding protein 5/6)